MKYVFAVLALLIASASAQCQCEVDYNKCTATAISLFDNCMCMMALSTCYAVSGAACPLDAYRIRVAFCTDSGFCASPSDCDSRNLLAGPLAEPTAEPVAAPVTAPTNAPKSTTPGAKSNAVVVGASTLAIVGVLLI